jgi:hypothetical protein
MSSDAGAGGGRSTGSTIPPCLRCTGASVGSACAVAAATVIAVLAAPANANQSLTHHRAHVVQTIYDPALKLSKNEPVVTVASKDPHGFRNVQPYLYWSCAGKKIEGTCHGLANSINQEWSYSFGNGFLGTDVVSNQLYVGPYYRH